MEIKDYIVYLLNKLPEVYQDVELQGEIIAKGKRNCEERWNLIKDSIKPHGVVLDVGSSLGYYSIKIAQTYPDSLVISFESDPIMCQIQEEIFKAEGIYNVVVCNYRLSLSDIARWKQHADVFDTILALAVVHHYPKQDVANVIDSFIRLGDLIIETPPAEEEEACGGGAKQEILAVLSGLEGEWLGDTPSHLGEYKREIHLYPQSGDRSNLDAFFGVSHPDRHRFEISNGQINGKEIIKGVNVWNLLHFNIVWPHPHWWHFEATAAYMGLDWKSDVRPWNLLITPTGLKAIDYTTKFPAGDQAEFKPEDLRKLADLFSEMKPIEWDKL